MLSRRNFLVKTMGVGAAVLGTLGVKSEIASAGSLAARFMQQPGAKQSKLYDILQRGKVVVGTGSGNPPWHFEDESGNLQGMDVEMAKLLSNGLFGKTDAIEFVREQSDARVPNLQTDKVDIVIQFMTVTAQRAQLVEFTVPYYREGANTLLLKDSKYNGAKDLAAAGDSVTVSVLQNVYAEDLIHEVMPKAKVMQLDSQANVMLALDSGRVDAAGVDDSTVRWMAAQDPNKYKAGDTGWYPQTYAAGVKPGDQIWLNFVNTVFHEAMTGVDWKPYAAAFKKYFALDLSSPATGFPVEFK
jgi:polar amino acid transport system substrate-binding protein